jgi:hypothetical protein
MYIITCVYIHFNFCFMCVYPAVLAGYNTYKFVFIFIVVCKFIHRIFLKFLNQANELYVSESFSFFGFKNKQFPANLKPVQAFNSGSKKKSANIPTLVFEEISHPRTSGSK